MPFSPNQYKSYLGHRFKGLMRMLKSDSRNRYIDQFKSLNVPLDSVLKLDGTPEYCHLCGYANARLILNSDWVVHTCSAFMLPEIAQNPAMAKWADKLEKFSELPTQTFSDGGAAQADESLSPAQPALAGKQIAQPQGD